MENQFLMQKIMFFNRKYREGEPQISDEEYDALLEKLKNNISEDVFDEFLKTLREPTGEIEHEYTIGSLRKCTYGTDEFKKFITKNPSSQFFAAAKLDGMGFVATYLDGILVHTLTIGDGVRGEDITEKSKYILPNLINTKEKVIIRGEFILSKTETKFLNFANPRNAVVGIFKRKEIDLAQVSRVHPFVFQIVNDTDLNRKEQYEVLVHLGFTEENIPPYKIFHNSKNIEEELKEYLEEIRNENDFLIDGLVFSSLDAKPENTELPKYTVAFKVNTEFVKSKIVDMRIETSKDGRLKGVAVIEPVTINGTVVQNVSIFNFAYVAKEGIGPGAEVIVTKAGEIIPKIVDVLKRADIQFEKYWELCSCCLSKTEFDGVDRICKNADCKSQQLGSVYHFLKNFDVKGAGETSLINWNISSINDILNFVPFDENGKKFLKDFKEKVLTTTPEEIFSKLDWGGIGEKIINKLVKEYGFKKLIEMGKDKRVPAVFPKGVGNNMWDKYLCNFDKNFVILTEITSHHEFSIKKEEKINNILNGKTFCFTGKLSKPRKQLEQLVKDNGGQIDSVKKGLNYLVCGEKAGSKLQQAQKYNIKILNEDEFFKIIEKGEI